MLLGMGAANPSPTMLLQPGTATPTPAEIVDINLATLVLILGVFIAIVGIIIAGVVYRESREWKKMVLPMFDNVSTDMVAGSPAEPGGLTPRMAAYGKEIFGRVFNHMDVAGLLGGAAIVILGILVILIGLSIGS
jgi:hypothetical protein